MGADIRIRIRERIIRIRVSETGIRAVIRITAETHAPDNRQPYILSF